MKFLKTIELQYGDLKAASLCKAKNDVRFYLCGIYLGDGFISATNGHVALIINEENLNGFDFTGKKVGFIYSGARSNKKEYFDLEKDKLF